MTESSFAWIRLSLALLFLGATAFVAWKKGARPAGLLAFYLVSVFILVAVNLPTVATMGPKDFTENGSFGPTEKDCVYAFDAQKKRWATPFCFAQYRLFDQGDYPIFLKRRYRFGSVKTIRVEISRYYDLATFMETLADFRMLRFHHFENLFRIHGPTVLDQFLPVWEKRCLEKAQGVFCRAAGYVYNLRGDLEKTRQIQRRGCELDDTRSCMAFQFNDFFSAKEKKWAKKRRDQVDAKNASSTSKKACSSLSTPSAIPAEFGNPWSSVE